MKAVLPDRFQDLGIQVAFVNTFHLAEHPGTDIIAKMGGIHEYARLPIPLMSDSAGFQVFSLGTKKHFRTRAGDEAPLRKITDEGVLFRSPRNGKEIWFTPEGSILHQEKIGADLIMAFDECLYLEAEERYARASMERTHAWLDRCLRAHRRKDQLLYGIVQGGRFRSLREESAREVAKRRVGGIAIGGVSVGEAPKEMKQQVRWVVPHLPESLPRHLLGVGRLEDIREMVEEGIDTFDCAEPTRIARSGLVYERKGERFARLDLLKAAHKADKRPIDAKCSCYACAQFSRSYLHHLFKERELAGYELATLHNLSVFSRFFADIRKEIREGKI